MVTYREEDGAVEWWGNRRYKLLSVRQIEDVLYTWGYFVITVNGT